MLPPSFLGTTDFSTTQSLPLGIEGSSGCTTCFERWGACSDWTGGVRCCWFVCLCEKVEKNLSLPGEDSLFPEKILSSLVSRKRTFSENDMHTDRGIYRRSEQYTSEGQRALIDDRKA